MWLDQYGYAEFNYWSSTHADDNNAYNFCYNDFIFQVDASYFRHVGMGVRLVTTAYQIRATINPAGTGTVEGTGAYALGETCTITAIPNDGYAFVGWTIDDEVVSYKPSGTFTVDQDCFLVANFAAVRTISASVNPSSGGAIVGLYDFEDGNQGWTALDNDGDGHNWIESILYDYCDYYDYLSGNFCMMSASYDEINDEALTPDNWLISPQVELGGSVSLWACGLDSYDPEEHFAIYVSTSGTNVGDFSQVTDEYVTGDKMAEYVADLSEYAGMGYIAIRHFNCTDQYYLLVDDIDIVSPSLSMNHLEGEPSSLLALPNAGYEFVNWTKDGVEVSTDVEYSFDVSGDESFVANFVENNNTYEITVAASPETAGVVTGGGTYLHNAVCTLTATPAEGYVFVAWTENEETVSTDAEYRFRATQERILVAEFVPIYTVNISATPSGGGTVLFEDANLYEITVGTEETISHSYVPVYGFYTDSYLKCEMVYPANELSDMMGKDIDGITYYSWHSNISWGDANFRVFITEVESNQIDAFVGEGTVVYEGPLGIDDNGEMLVSFTAPYRYNGGNLLVGVYNTVKGTYVNAPWHGEVREGVSVQGYSFSSLDAITPTQRNYLPKTTFAYESGINEKTYPSGETCTLLARPNEGYEFDSWRENGEVVSESPSYSFEVLSDRSLEAYFEGNGSYLLSLNAVPEEAGKLFANLYYEIETPFAPSERIEEQDISVVAAANKGWRFAYWTSNGEVIPANNVYNFHLSEDTELVAHFEPCEVATEPDPDLLSGRFSISGCTTVGFAKGNVIAQIQIDTINDLPVATSASWQFAETQYYRQEYEAEAIAENGIGNLLSEGMDLVYDVYRSIGLVDIGCWHLLSSAEWDYLLNGRPIEIRYAFATVNGVAGLLVLPDDWAAATYELDSPNVPAAYETNEIALADWQTTLEPAGALFLPANGMLMCPPTGQGNCQYQYEASDGTIVGSYGNMMFHPTMGIINVTSYPIMGYVWAEVGGYFSMRLAQVVAQATSTVTVSVTEDQAEYGMVSGGDSFACGAECTVVATPNEGYVFRYWLEDGEVASVDAEYTFKVAGDRALVAVFAEDNTVCNIQFELVSDERYFGMFGWGGEVLQLHFNDDTPDISLTIPAPEVDWNAIVVAGLAGDSFNPSSYGFPQSRIYTIPINRGASDTLSWIAPSMGENNVLELSNTFSVSYESGESIFIDKGKDDLPLTFLCNCDDITLSVDPEEGGTITTEGTLSYGETATLTAVANEGYTFVNWTLNGEVVSTDPIYSFVVTQAGEMVAHFQLNTYEITATASPAEGGTVTGGGTYSHGATCVLTASPNTNYAFVNWTVNDEEVSTEATYSITVTEDRDLVANFRLDVFEITAVSSPETAGTITGAGTYNYGATCTLTAVPNETHVFVSWTENDEVVSTDAEYQFVVAEARSLVAHFASRIDATAAPAEGGSVAGPGIYEDGTTCTLTATANTGYSFVNWTENGEVVATDAEYAFTVEGNRTLQANFSPNSYEISALVTPEAAGTVTGTGTYEYGTTCTLTAIPNEGYVFLKWADFYWNYESTYEFTVTGDAQFTAIFEALPNGVYVGTGGGKTNPYLPTYTGSNYSITQQIYTSSEIGDAMEIVNLSYYNEGGENTRVLDIYMAHTDVESIPTDAPNTGWVALTEDNLVFSGSVTMKQGCWNTIYLDAPFAYDGSTNVAIVVNDKTGSSTSNYLNCRVYNANGVQAILDYGSTSYDPLNPPQAWSYYGNPAIKNQIIFNRFCTVTASSDPEQGGTVAGTGTFACGSQCTLVATPNEGYAFQYWLENGEVVSYNAAYSFTVAGDHTLVAHFEPSCVVEPQNVLVSDLGVTEATVSWTSENDLFELRYRKGLGATTDFEQGIPYGWTTIDADGDGYNWRTYYNLGYNGSIGAASASWNGNVLYPDNYLVTPRVDLGGTFSFWACALDSDCAAEHFGVAVSTTGQTVASEFVTVQEWTLTAKKRDGLSNVLRGGNRDQGTWYHYSVDLSSYAGQSGYIAIRHFDCSNQYYLVIDDVQYVPDNEWTVVTGLNTTSYTLTNLEDMGDYIVEVRSSCGDGIGYSDWVSCTFNNEMHYTITAVANPTDWGTVTGAGTYPANDLIQLMAIANEGYGFLFWTENGEVVADDATYVFTVTEDRDLVAHFAPNTQTYSLTPGWSWISTYIEQEGPEGLAMLEEGLNPNGVMIKSQLDGFLSYVSGIGMWVGTLDAIANEKMYMVHLLDNAEFTLTGTPASASAHPITLYPNWNWVGYPSMNPAAPNDALANLNASNEDVIKSMSGFLFFDEDYGWWGDLEQLIPGEGYMYYSHNTQPIELTYPFDLNRSPKTNVTPESSHWKAAVHAYPNNMNLIVVVELDGEELQEDRYELAAFVGDECRGSARLSYVDPLRRYVAFLTVAGEEAADFCLALYDTETGKAYMNTTDCLGFEADAVMGSLRSPYVVRFEGATGMDESFAHTILLHPNPVSKGEVFQLELPAENDGARVSLVNALGEVVSVADLNAKPATMCAPTSPGVYVVRIETRSHGTYCKKLIVK